MNASLELSRGLEVHWKEDVPGMIRLEKGKLRQGGVR